MHLRDLSLQTDVQRKTRRKARKVREQQLLRDLLAFQEEMMRTDAELTVSAVEQITID
jgi:hypothetical protein